MRIACVYHSIDLDGWMSAAIVKHWFNQQEVPNGRRYCSVCGHTLPSEWAGSTPCCGGMTTIDNISIDFIGYNYGQDIPDLSEYDKIIMCDISFTKEEMGKLLTQLNGNLIWIDHHVSAITANKELMSIDTLYGLRDTKFAACELTWEYFFPDEAMPEIVRLLGRYDCFGHKGTDEETKVLEHQYGARRCISNYEEAYEYLVKDIKNSDPKCKGLSVTANIIREGKAIYQYLCTEAKQTYKNGFEVMLENKSIDFSSRTDIKLHPKYKFICFNANRFNPINFGIDYHKDGYDGVMTIHFANRKWNVSLYNDNGLVDCSVIAKQFGGGGHKGASGFILDSIEKTLEIFPMAEELREKLKSAL